MVSASGMDHVPLHLDDMDLVFTENNVATWNTTVVQLIESVSEGAAVDGASDTGCDNSGCAPAVDNIVHVPWEFGALPEL